MVGYATALKKSEAVPLLEDLIEFELSLLDLSTLRSALRTSVEEISHGPELNEHVRFVRDIECAKLEAEEGKSGEEWDLCEADQEALDAAEFEEALSALGIIKGIIHAIDLTLPPDDTRPRT